MPPLDFPFDAVVAEAKLHFESGHTVYQKFSCGRCCARQTMAEPNKFFRTGICEECGFQSNIEQQGCNYLVMMSAQTLDARPVS